MNIETASILASGVFAFVKGFAFVKEGQLGSKTFFGKATRGKDGKIKVVKPGFVILIPLVNSLQKAHIRMDSVELRDLNVTLNNGLSYHYSAFVAFHVSDKPDDLEKFLYKVENTAELISQKLSSEIRELLVKEDDPQKATGKEINDKLSTILSEYLLEKIGITMDSCGITSLTESAQAQQVNVAVSKLDHAKKHFGDSPVPESVVAACFGATPIVAPQTKEEAVYQKKKEGFFDRLFNKMDDREPVTEHN